MISHVIIDDGPFFVYGPAVPKKSVEETNKLCCSVKDPAASLTAVKGCVLKKDK